MAVVDALPLSITLAQIDARLTAEAECKRLRDELASLTRRHNLLHTRFTVARVRLRRALRFQPAAKVPLEDRRWWAANGNADWHDQDGPPDAA